MRIVGTFMIMKVRDAHENCRDLHDNEGKGE
jgi:hypothetical protein